MSRFKVVLQNPTVPQIAYTLLQEKCNLIVSEGLDRASVLKVLPGADALFWSSRLKVDKEVLDVAGPQLKVIGSMSSGHNHIDLHEVKARGIKLGNTPKVLDSAVADKAVMLALSAASRLTESRWAIERGTWGQYFDAQWLLGQDISGSTVGIIGLGGVGQTIACRLKAFDVAKILYTGHREKPEGKALGLVFVNLETLTKESDFIFLSAPLNNETKGMCNPEFFLKMKNTAVFVNVSRGELVDQDALVAALKEGQIFAAGLDVMTPEPLPTDSELLRLPNVVLTPHTGSATKKTRDAMAELTAQNILRGLAGQELLTPVELESF